MCDTDITERARRIDYLLPQTQCGRCGYAGCRPYAEAIARGDTDINRCPPGGETTITALADLLDREPKPLDPDCGEHKGPRRAVIDEPECIGCTKCIQACPVDAIVGAAKQMHTVIANECTGCELCIPPCPVDCIDLVVTGTAFDKDKARRRYERRTARLQRVERRRARRTGKSAQPSQPAGMTLEQRRAVIRAAVARAKAKRKSMP